MRTTWSLSLVVAAIGTTLSAYGEGGDAGIAAEVPTSGDALELLRAWGVEPKTMLSSNGVPYYVRSETDMTPPRCKDYGDLAARALCAAEDLRSFFGPMLDSRDISSLHLQSMSRGHSEEEMFLRFNQEHLGVVVRPGHLVASFRGSSLMSLSGEISHVSDIVALPQSMEASRVVGPLPVDLSYQYVDGIRGQLVGVYTNEGDPLRDEHILDIDGNVIELRRTAAFSGDRTLSVWVDSYANGYLRHQSGGSVQQTVSAYCQDGTGVCGSSTGVCRFYTQRAPNTSGYPQKTLVQYRPSPDGGANVEEIPYVDAACNSSFPWSSVNLGYYEFFATSNFGQIQRAADMKSHWSQFLYYAEATQRRLEIKVQTNQPLPYNAVYTVDSGANTGRISSWQSIWPSTAATQAQDISTSFHEYGHHVHDRYGYHGTSSVKEGWADQYALRFARYMYDFGGWSIGYASTIGMDLEFRHGEAAPNQEYLIDDLFSGGNEPDMYRDGPSCVPGAGFEEHVCGQVIGMVYWELAWNHCKLRYLSCANNQDIIQSGPYLSNPWALANSAFGYAVSEMPSGGSVSDFMLLVYERYAEFQSVYNYLSSADLARVGSVMAHHCLGPSDFCSPLYHKLPGSRLPNRYTQKTLAYAEAEFNAPAGSVYASTYTASGGQEVGMTEPTVGGNSSRFVRFTINTAGGSHSIRPLAAKPTAGAVTIYWRVNSGSWQTSTLTLPTTYDWVILGSQTLPYGTSTVDVRVAYNQSFWLDGLKLVIQ